MGKSKNIDDREVGFDFDLKLNQIAARRTGLRHGDITIDELIIFESFIKYTSWAKSKNIRVRGDEIFYHYNWIKIAERIPFMSALTRNPIEKKLKKLVTNKLLKAHPHNQKMGKAFYTFGENYKYYSNQVPALKTGQVYTEKSADLHQKQGTTCTKKSAPPVLKRVHDLHQKQGTYISTSIKTNINTNNNSGSAPQDNLKKSNIESSKNLKDQISNQKIYTDSPENRIEVWKLYECWMLSQTFQTQWGFYADRYPEVEPLELMKVWVTKADWHQIINVKINQIQGWIKRASQDITKLKLSTNGKTRNNKNLVSESDANSAFNRIMSEGI